MPRITDGLLREDDGSLSVTEDATGAAYDGGWLRSPTNELVVTLDDTDATIDNGFLRAPSGALVIAEEAGVEMHNGLLRTASGALAATRDPTGLQIVSGLPRADGLLVLTGLDPLGFTDGFESGDTSAWSSTNQAVGGAVTVSALAARTGGAGCRITNTTVAGSLANVRREFAPRDEIEANGWFRWNSDPGGTGNSSGLRIFAGGTRVVDVYKQDTSLDIELRTRRQAGTFRFVDTGQNAVIGTWVKIGLSVVFGTAGVLDSRVIVTVNDAEVHNDLHDLSDGGYTIVQYGTEHPQMVDMDVDDCFVSA